MHNSHSSIFQVHIIVGLGNDLPPPDTLTPNLQGVMGDVAASPNDPVFINHHVMIDCIFEMWLQKNRGATYPNNGPNAPRGHQSGSYLVPFFPLFKHEDMMMTGDNFGYSCNLPDTPGSTPPNSGNMATATSKHFNLIMSVAVGVILLVSN